MDRTFNRHALIFLLVCLSFMVGFTDVIDTSLPGGGDDPREADDNMRRIQGGFVESLNVTHHFDLTGTELIDEKTDYHKFWYNVKAYGATGDGATDDTAAIQEAIDAMEANLGGVIYFPISNYRVTDTFHLDSANNSLIYHFKGEGRNSKIKHDR